MSQQSVTPALVGEHGPDLHIATTDGEIRPTPVTAALGDPLPERFEAVLTIEGERTTDDREIALGALIWRELPIPLMFDIDEQGHHGGAVGGRIEEIARVNVGTRAEIRARGSFDLGSESGREAARQVGEQLVRWVSIDMEVLEEDIFTEGDCDLPTGEPDEVDDLLFPSDCRIIMRVNQGRIMGATMVAFPAFPGAVIVPEGTEIPAATDNGRPEPVPPAPASVVAAGIPTVPPRDWFTKPDVDGPTPMTISPEGRIYAYAARWGECHIGRTDICITAPNSASQYAYFQTGATRVACDCGDADHDEIPTGVITLDTGHAALDVGHAAAAAHYDHTGTAVADVVAGEDEHGIWIAGALRPGVTEEQIRILRGSSLSGDWRRVGGSLELVALLAVNVPGFPVPRAQARVASGVQVALVASVGPAPERPETALQREIMALQERLSVMERVMRPLLPTAARAILASVEVDE